MRLSAFNPQLGARELTFDCPKCGKPYRVSVHISPSAPSAGFWQISLPPQPMGEDGWDGVTISPSIINENHGRKKSCGWHGSIINGNIITN